MTGAAPTPLVRIDSLTKRFGQHTVLTEVSTTVAKGEVVALIGPSGGGKSTLLRCINLLETPTSGVITVDGIEFGAEDRHRSKKLIALRRDVGMVFQGFNLFPHMTALENIMLGQMRTLGRSRADAAGRGRELLEKVGLSHKADEHPGRLSGGQQQRVAIARALALDPSVMLFDEPTSAIDPELRVEVLAVMRALADEGMTMIIATHEMTFAEDVADRVLFLADGVIAESGPAKSVLRDPQHERTRRFLGAVLGRTTFSPADEDLL